MNESALDNGPVIIFLLVGTSPLSQADAAQPMETRLETQLAHVSGTTRLIDYYENK